MAKVKVSATGFYAGHSIKANGTLDLKMTFSSNEMSNTVKFLAMIGKPLKLGIFADGEKPTNLGEFTIDKIEFTKNAETKMKFASTKDYVVIQNMVSLLAEETAFNVVAIQQQDENK